MCMSSSSRRGARWLTLMAAVAVLIAVIMLLGAVEDTADVTQAEAVSTPPVVTVEPLSVGDHQARVEVLAEVKPRWNADLKAEVGGLVVKVDDRALAGNRVQQGDPLAVIEDTRYQAELAEAEQLFREAQLAAEQAEYASRVARRQFSRAGEQPPNDLALQLPQLDIAKAAVDAAQARLNLARRQLRQTVIRAPYSGYVIRRYVSPGQMVMTGDPVANLIGDRHQDIEVRLSRAQWQLLAQPLAGQSVAILDDQGERLGKAVVRQAGGYLDETTRQYVVHLSDLVLEQDESRVLVGDLVTVRFDGRVVSNSLSIPATALTAEGAFWWVEGDDILAKSPASVVARLEDRVLVQAPEARAQWQVVALPMASYLPGQRVRPRVREVR